MNPDDPVPQIDSASAKVQLDGGRTLFIDIRDPDSYREGHIPGALHLTDENVQQFLSEADKAHPTIVCCYHGNSSQGAAAFLLSQGFTDVKSLTGGFEGWRHRFPSDPQQ